MNRCQLGLGLLVAALVCGRGGSSRAAEPGRVEWKLDVTVPWEALPAEVTEIVPGPDGRWWYRLAPERGMVPTLAEQKAVIVREFGKADPQLPFVRAMVFEPGGRVWFAATSRREGEAVGRGAGRVVGPVVTLLGYDGHDFVEYAPKGKLQIDPRSRRLDDQAPAFCAAGAVFFSGPDRMAWWDGKDWTEKTFPATKTFNGVEQVLSAYPEADGKGVLVFVPATGELWRWREGVWRCIASGEWVGALGVPKLSNSVGLLLDAVHVRPEGIWLKTSRGLAFVPLGKPSAKLAALVKQLDDPEDTRRDAASAAIAAMGPEIAGELQMAMTAGLSAEQVARLKLIPAAAPLEVLKGGELFEGKPMKLGAFTLLGVESLHAAPDGSTLIGAELAGGEYRVIKIDKGERVSQLGDVETFRATEDPGRVMPAGGQTAWFLQFGRNGASSGNRVDLNTGQVVERFPASFHTWPELMSADGRSWYVAYGNRIYYVFHPGAPGAATADMLPWK